MECGYNLKSSEFYLSTGLSALEQEWLADNLKRRHGIQDVTFDANDPARLMVSHDADITAPLAVRDMLLLHGIHVKFSSTFGRPAVQLRPAVAHFQ